jgi:DHA2 family multidrug resistance protein
MGNATSLFNLMRNIGGSVGIATATTMIARKTQTFLSVYGQHINPYNPTQQAMTDMLRGYFISRGADAATATREAYAALDGILQQQAALLSYLNVFKFFGFVFLVMLPLVLIMKRPARASGPVAMH